MAFVYDSKHKHTPPCDFPGEQKWALFDLDWTLIRPTTRPDRPTLKGGPFCYYSDDWIFIPGRIERLKDFIREGFSLSIVSNQKYSGTNLLITQTRIENIWNALARDFPEIIILYSTDETSLANPNQPESIYCKPGNGWGYHLRFSPGSLSCGDACQDTSRRDRGWGYSNSDRQFALNMGLIFYSPEEVFPQLNIPDEIFLVSKVVLILVGCPGSGKTTFAQKLNGFCHIESDAFKSNWSKIKKVYRAALSRQCPIILDATNPTRERRLEIIRIADEYSAPVGIILFVNPGKWNEHRPSIRPKIAFNMYWSRFEEPSSCLEYGVPVYYQV